jgi:hypothetical protein
MNEKKEVEIISCRGIQAQEHRISRSTLNYLRKNARENKTFRVYEKVAARLGHV